MNGKQHGTLQMQYRYCLFNDRFWYLYDTARLDLFIRFAGYVHRIVAIRRITRWLLGHCCDDRYSSYLLLYWQDTR